MDLYNSILKNKEYLKLAHDIGKMKFITNGKWDWEHGLGHYQRVASYVKLILMQLGADKRTIDLGMSSALLHDIGLIKGEKVNHAIESSNMFTNFIKDTDILKEEQEIIRQAIYDHSSCNDIKSLVGLSLALADKLDVTYHRTINSSIQDETNKEFGKVKSVDIKITKDKLIVYYKTEKDFNINILKSWNKTITIPLKISRYLNKEYVFIINGKEILYNEILK